VTLIKLEDVQSLEQFVPASADLTDTYWSPEEGDSKRLVFWAVETRRVPDFNDITKDVDLKCALFLEPDGDNWKTVVNGSKRLVATLENNEIAQGTPVEVKYLGRKQNRTNSNKSDRWSVLLLKKGGES